MIMELFMPWKGQLMAKNIALTIYFGKPQIEKLYIGKQVVGMWLSKALGEVWKRIILAQLVKKLLSF